MTSDAGRRRALTAALFLLSLTAACSEPAPPASQATPPIVSRPAEEPITPAGDDEPPAPTAEANATGPASQTPASEPAAATRLDVDLERDERRGGHTIARHVGRSDAQLRARLSRESIAAASTYPDLETAERVVAQTLAANERRVLRWIDQRGPRANLAVRYRARDGLPTGRMLRRGDEASAEVSGAVVVLRWRDEAWYVLTSYPEEPR
jgi:hypothetical protein